MFDSQYINVEKMPPEINLGYQGDNKATRITFDWTPWARRHGVGTMTVLLLAPGETAPRTVLTESENTRATWLPTSTDTAAAGWYQIQLKYTVSDKIGQTRIIAAKVTPSLIYAPAEESPDDV